ncbi:hypothetical protein IV454_13830 [Massilia antarctica]|uniref:Lipoprotein n=1 Tax=Massilia antarctica TaxID=2765360 RepID=A0AA48WIP4_9BURK|nr:hypothetical protein [Massilia antarctica]QPI52468.1 hypothetical protein IV454_13830 [Massilia antarctica]
MNKLIFAFAAAGVFTSCSAAPVKEELMRPKQNGTVALLPQHSTLVAPDATLRYERVEDSRCPPDVVCISAGKIVYYFTLIYPTAVEPFTLEPAAPAYASLQRPELNIALAIDPPPPRPSKAPPPEAQPVILNIGQPSPPSH